MNSNLFVFFSIDRRGKILLHFYCYEGKISYFTDAAFGIVCTRGKLPRGNGRRYGFGAGSVFGKRNRFELSGKFNKNYDAVSDV